jgi:hypothetical protein
MTGPRLSGLWRERLCLSCRHAWTQQQTFDWRGWQTQPEPNVRCPACRSGCVMSGPARRIGPAEELERKPLARTLGKREAGP